MIKNRKIATKATQKNTLALFVLMITIIISSAELQALPWTCYHYVTVEVTSLTNGCGLQMVVTNPECFPYSPTSTDNAIITVKDQNNIVMYSDTVNMLQYYGSNNPYNVIISALPQHSNEEE